MNCPFDHYRLWRFQNDIGVHFTLLETSAKLRPLAELMNPASLFAHAAAVLSIASLTLQRHMSVSNLSPRNISNIPAG